MRHIEEYDFLVNENVSDVDIIKYHIKELKNLNYHVDLGFLNNRISLTHNGLNLFNTNNTNLGVQYLNTFLAGFVMGMKEGR